MRYALLIPAILLAAVSTTMTVRACWQLGGEMGALAVAIGLGFEAGKYALCIAAPRLGMRLRWAAYALAAVLALCSVAGSVLWMRQSDARISAERAASEHASMLASDAYRDHRAELAALDAQLAGLERTRSVYLDAGRATAARELAPRIEALASERRELAARPPEHASATNAPGYWDAFGGDAARHAAHFIVAALIELVAFACVGFASAMPVQTRGRIVSQEIDTPMTVTAHLAAEPVHAADTPSAAPELVPDAPEPLPPPPPPPSDTTNVLLYLDPYRRLTSALRAGLCKPSVRGVQEHLGVGQQKAQQLIKRAVDEGVVERDERGRYRVAQGAA